MDGRASREWGQDGARIERLRKAADFAIYTPGSRAGRPVSILSSFAAPSAAERDDAELLASAPAAPRRALLALAGVDADRRAAANTACCSHASDARVAARRDLDLAALIRRSRRRRSRRSASSTSSRSFRRKERFALAMQLNGVLAAPGFEVWLEGDPLDPQTLFYDAAGQPRVPCFRSPTSATPSACSSCRC